ncbi:MAG: putative secreted protein [Candidatus Eremiobacteraeota bacterium]|nr:putative secreted protein [Candidatus Eremiobacteraeota bacterium]
MKIDAAKAVLAAAFLTVFWSPVSAADDRRKVQVERNSERVMPFSMDATMHRFVPTPGGGVQTVTVHDGDRKQVSLVRSHLRKEASAFAHGDFGDPASIHGGAMPGLRALHAGAKRIAIRYADVPNGASISYATRDPALVSALHAWFKAQVGDHGAHATMKM